MVIESGYHRVEQTVCSCTNTTHAEYKGSCLFLKQFWPYLEGKVLMPKANILQLTCEISVDNSMCYVFYITEKVGSIILTLKEHRICGLITGKLNEYIHPKYPKGIQGLLLFTFKTQQIYTRKIGMGQENKEKHFRIFLKK